MAYLKKSETRFRQMDDPNRRRLMILWFAACVACAIIAPHGVGAFPGEWRAFGERLRRYIINDHEVTVNVEWLTDEQLSELGTLDSPAQVAKIRQFYEQLVSSEERKAAANKIVTQCYDWLPEVTTEAERAELKRLHRVNHTECNTRIAEYISRLAEHRQNHLRRYWNFCEHVSNDTTRYAEHVDGEEILDDDDDSEGHTETTTPADLERHQSRRHAIINPTRVRRSSHHHNHEDHKHDHNPLEDLEHCFTEHLKWLNDAQKDTLRALKAAGKSEGEIQAKIFDYYDQTTGRARSQATASLKTACADVFRSIFSDEQEATLTRLRDQQASAIEITAKTQEFLAAIQDPVRKNRAKELGPNCQKLLMIEEGAARRRRDAGDQHDHKTHHSLDDYYKTHLAWLNDAQKAELNQMKEAGKGFPEMKAKIEQFFEASTGETRAKATELLKSGCVELFKSVFGNEKLQEIRKLKESGTPIEEIAAKIDGFKTGLDEEKKAKADRYGPHCKQLFTTGSLKLSPSSASRKRRATTDQDAREIELYYKSHLSWLTDAQKAELSELKTSGGGVDQVKARIQAFYAATTGEARTKATALLKEGCVELFKLVFGDEKFQEIRALRDAGTPIEEITAKIDAFTAGLDEANKARVSQYGPHCRRLFAAPTAPARRRRDARHDHDHDHGVEHGHEHGYSGDQHDHKAHHSLDDYYKTHLAWLNDAQKAELNQMKEAGKGFTDMKAKIEQFFEASTGETRAKATELLKGGCVELFKSVFGDEKLQEIRKLKESGTPIEEIAAKIDGFKAGLDEEKKVKADRYGPYCKQLFTTGTLNVASSRKRRSVHFHQEHIQLENPSDREYPHGHIKWLSDEQLDQLKISKRDGADSVMLQRQVFAMRTQINDDNRRRRLAELHLRRDCLEYFATGLLHQLDALYQEHDQRPISEVLAAWHAYDSRHRRGALNKLYSEECDRLMYTANTMETELGAHFLDEWRTAFDRNIRNGAVAVASSSRGWLADDAQRVRLNARLTAETDEDRIELLKLLFRLRDEAPSDKAELQLRYACMKLYIWARVALHSHVSEILTEAGETALEAPTEALLQNIDVAVHSMGSNSLIQRSLAICQDGTEPRQQAQRERRHAAGGHAAGGSAGHSLEDYFRTHLAWLNEEQKSKLRALKAEGKSRAELQSRVLGFYEDSTGEARAEATKLLKAGCVEFFKAIFGEEKFQELKGLKAGGASTDELLAKVDAYTAALTDEHQRQRAAEYGPQCRVLFGMGQTSQTGPVTGRRRRHIAEIGEVHPHEHHSLQDYFNTHLSWLTDAQKAELTQMKESGKERSELHAKIDEYYTGTTGETRDKATAQLKGVCREMFLAVFGEEKLQELRKLGAEGATPTAIAATVQRFADALTDEAKRTKAQLYIPHCRKLWGAEQPARRRRRDVGHSLESYYKTHLGWLNDAQKAELNQMKAAGKNPSELKTKIHEFYEATTGETRTKATTLLKGSCVELFRSVFGEEKLSEVKQLRESGTSIDEISDKIAKYQDQLTDPAKKTLAQEYGPYCKQLFASANRQKRSVYRKKHRSLLDYFETHLSWLTEEQKEELLRNESIGYPGIRLEEMVERFYASTTGERRQRATRLLRAACTEWYTALLGAEAIEELERLRDNGASLAEIHARVDEVIATLGTEDERYKARDYAAYCRRIHAINAVGDGGDLPARIAASPLTFNFGR